MQTEFHNDWFAKNPCPMWVFDAERLQFLLVNEAACAKYLYTFEEFYANTIFLIRPEQEFKQLIQLISVTDQNKFTEHTYFIHRDRLGRTFRVKAFYTAVSYKGRPAAFVQITDVEDYFKEKDELNERLDRKKQMLEQLAFNEAHLLRSKIANLLAIVQLYQSGGFKYSEMYEIAKIAEQEILEADKIISTNIADIKTVTVANKHLMGFHQN